MTVNDKAGLSSERWATRRYGRPIEASAWLAAALAILLAESLSYNPASLGPSVAFSCLACVFGTRVFLRHGGTQITAVGIYSYAFALFVGGSGLYFTVAEPIEAALRTWLLIALASAYMTQVITVFTCWTTWRRLPTDVLATPFDRQTRSAAVYLGSLLLGISILAKSVGIAVEIAVGTAMTAVVLVAAALMLSDRARIISVRSVVVLGLLAIFVRYFHGGTGRLQIATLAFALAILYALRFRSLVVKWGVIIGTVPAVWWAARYREEYVRAAFGGEVNGLGSAVRPMWTYAKLLSAYHDHAYSLAWGSTLITPLTSFLPSWLWSNKPMAFGYAIAMVTEPEKFGTGYSDAGSVFGEWFWNFSFVGLALLVPVIGLAIRWIDLIIPSASLQPRVAVLYVIAAAIASAGVSDLVWGGLHTYVVRTAIRLIVLLPIISLAQIQATRWSQRDCTAQGGIGGNTLDGALNRSASLTSPKGDGNRDCGSDGASAKRPHCSAHRTPCRNEECVRGDRHEHA